MKIPRVHGRAVIAIVLVLITPALVPAQIPAGSPITVTTYQGASPSVATDASGNFVVVWKTQDSGDSGSVMARRYDAAGNALGAEFQVNSYTTGYQGSWPGPRVASDAAGNFVVVWSSRPNYPLPEPQDGSGSGVFAQRYDAAGSPRGSEFRVNTFTTSHQWEPSVASDATGNFVVSWSSQGQDGYGYGVFAQRYDAAGAPQGPEYRVNAYTTDNQRSPSIASGAAGHVVVWSNETGAGALLGQRFDTSGAPRGSEFQVAADRVQQPNVASRADGSFVVSWSAYDADLFGVFARRYDSAGAALGGEFQVNTTTTGFQTSSVIALDAAGAIVVAWGSAEDVNRPYLSEIRAQRYDASGSPRGGEFRADINNESQVPWVAADASGNFVVVWYTSTSNQVLGQRFGGVSPAPSRVDPQASANSDGNGVLEPGESVEVMPFWRNVNGVAQTFDGSALDFSGPPAPGVSYDLQDALASYGTVPNGTTVPCSDCYGVVVPFGGTRPAIHWDATFEERLTPDTLGQTSRWALHVGDSFTDVPKTSGYYRFVETLLHRGVTSGCLATSYCPAALITREQMAVFVLVARQGAGYVAPACGATPMFPDVPVASPFCPWIEELARRHVVAGCGGGDYCPTAAVTREQMAVFVLGALGGPSSPPACVPPHLFGDVSQANPFCPWIEELANRGVVTGCGGGNYCPSGSVTREEMAVFISGTFGLTLYGP